MVPSSSSLIMKALDEPIRNRKEEKDSASSVLSAAMLKYVSYVVLGGLLVVVVVVVASVVHNGNITLDQVIEIARTMRPRSMARTLAGTVREILGTCFSIGCTVNDMHPRVLGDQIKAGDVPIPDE